MCSKRKQRRVCRGAVLARLGYRGVSLAPRQVLRQRLAGTRCRTLSRAPDDYLRPIRSMTSETTGAARRADPAIARCFVRVHVEITPVLLRPTPPHSGLSGEYCPNHASRKDTTYRRALRWSCSSEHTT